LHASPVKPSICHHHPVASTSLVSPSTHVVTVSAGITTQATQVWSVSAWSSPTAPREDQLGVSTHAVDPFHPRSKGAATATLVVSRSRSGRETRSIGSEHLFRTLHTQLGEEQPLHLVEVSHPQLLVSAKQRGVVRYSLCGEFQCLTHFIRSQEPLFHVSIAQFHVEGHQQHRQQVVAG
jgi:hypothetical protein